MLESHRTTLGRTGLVVSRMAVGSSYGIDVAGLVDAFHEGLNFFYFGTLRTRAMAEAVHRIAPANRDRLVVAIQSYARWGSILSRSVDAALRRLRLEYADILILGKVDKPLSASLIREVIKIRERGRVRYIAVSAHRRAAFADHLKTGICDIVMTRYNAAHTGSERDVFPVLPAENRPGVMCYTATRWGTLLKGAPGYPPPRARDCYRFVLNHPCVDVCMCGPANRDQLRDALEALRAPAMTAEELEWMRRVGKHVYTRSHHNFLLRKLIFD